MQGTLRASLAAFLPPRALHSRMRTAFVSCHSRARDDSEKPPECNRIAAASGGNELITPSRCSGCLAISMTKLQIPSSGRPNSIWRNARVSPAVKPFRVSSPVNGVLRMFVTVKSSPCSAAAAMPDNISLIVRIMLSRFFGNTALSKLELVQFPCVYIVHMVNAPSLPSSPSLALGAPQFLCALLVLVMAGAFAFGIAAQLVTVDVRTTANTEKASPHCRFLYRNDLAPPRWGGNPRRG